MRDATSPTNFIQLFDVPKLRTHVLFSTADIAEEIFAGLSYYANVPEAGKELLVARGVDPAILDDAFFGMRSFIRQSKAFYETARSTGPRSSPLIYYYAFLNLAKALICLRNPQKVLARVNHGLTLELKSVPLDQQSVSAVDGGLFTLLYQEIVGESLPKGFHCTILPLLTYCVDISSEIEETKAASHSTYPVMARALANKREKKSYVWLAIPSFKKFEECDVAKKRFFEYFDEVSVKPDVAREIFDIPAEIASSFRFFETKQTLPTDDGGMKPAELGDLCLKALEPYVLENPYFQPRQTDFWLCRPLAASHIVSFNQVVASYTILFFLSSLVRYYPVYFERQFENRDAWIIDGFIRSVPITLLRYLSNRFIGINRRYASY